MAGGPFLLRRNFLFTSDPSAVLKGGANCGACNWWWPTTHLVAVEGFSATTEKCGRKNCGMLNLVVYRTVRRPFPRTRFVMAIPIIGKNEVNIRAALAKVPDIDEDSIEFMIEAAKART